MFEHATFWWGIWVYNVHVNLYILSLLLMEATACMHCAPELEVDDARASHRLGLLVFGGR